MKETTEMEVSKNLSERLTKEYGNERVEEQPHIGIGDRISRPNFIVYKDTDKTEPLIVIKVKEELGKSIHSGIKQVKSFLNKVDAKFGALATPKFTYSFYLTEMDDYKYEVTIPDLPNLDDTYSEDKKPFESIEHLLFCFERIFSTDYENIQNDRDLTSMGIKNLTRKVFSEYNDIDLEWYSEIFKDLREIDEIIGEKYEFYEESLSIQSPAFSKIIQGIFNAYHLGETDNKIKRQFLERIISKEGKIGEYITKDSVAEFMVELSDIQDGDTVLDPASGIGNILRIASKSEGDCYGIEISNEILSYSIFFNEMLNLNLNLYNDDFLKEEKENNLPDEFDYIFIDPPLGRRITDEKILSQTELDRGINIESAFMKKSLELLKNRGELITLLPKGFLFRKNDSSIRSYIKDNYKIDMMIETKGRGLFPNSSIPGVIMKITNEEPSEGYQIKVAEIEADEDIEKGLARVQELIQEGNYETINYSEIENDLSPSKIRNSRKLKEELNQKFDTLTCLSEVCEIKRGERVEKSKRVNKKEGDFPFLRIGDIDENLENLSYVKKEDVNLTTKKTDVLISIKGTIGKVYLPEEEIVPAQSWIVLRFESKEEALVYATFLETKLAERQLKTLKTGTTIPYVSIKDLSNLYVPAFKKEEINQKAKEIIEIQSELENYQKHTDEMKRKLKEVF